MSAAPYILIVDDEWMNRELLEAYLKMGGYRVGQANSGEKALEMVAQEPPALVILDVCLTGISGLEVCRCLKDGAATRAIPILMVRALESPEDQQQAADAGADGYVAKPFEMEALLARIRSALAKA
jgi:two-component system phosphate regulon response regulator PhoB